MNLIRDFDGILTQAVSIKTDVEISTSLVCPLMCTATGFPAFASWTGSIIQVNGPLTTIADAGTHVLSLNCGSIAYPADVAPQTYTFTITVQHCVVNTFTISSITDVNYALFQGSLDVPYTSAVFSNLACQYQITHTASFAVGGVPVS